MIDSAFGFDQPEDSPGFLLWQVTVTWQRFIKKALGSYGLSHAQFVVLANIRWFEEQKQLPTQILISQQSKIDKMTVSKSLKILKEQGLVKRSEHQADTRAKSTQLTQKGRQLTTTLIPVIEAIDKKFFGTVSTAKQKSLMTILNKLVTKSAPLR